MARASSVFVHEACTTMNTNNWHATGSCSYWTNANGGIFWGSKQGHLEDWDLYDASRFSLMLFPQIVI
jgi:hypothetical protein